MGRTFTSILLIRSLLHSIIKNHLHLAWQKKNTKDFVIASYADLNTHSRQKICQPCFEAKWIGINTRNTWCIIFKWDSFNIKQHMFSKVFMNTMTLVIPLHFISWKKTPNDAVTPRHQSQFTPKMKANAVPRLLSSLVWIDHYNECNGMTSFMVYLWCCFFMVEGPPS